jgi:ribosomal protein S1
VIKVGDEIDVYILSLDKDDQRIALSRKRLLQNPWDTAEQRYQINQTVEGTVTRIVTYGAFVEIEPGVEGLLHISQLSRDSVEDPNQILKEGETHLLRVVSVDANRQRIGLSLKSVTAEEQMAWMLEREANQPEESEAEVEEVDEDESFDVPDAEDDEDVPEAEADIEEETAEPEADEDVEPEENQEDDQPVAEESEPESEGSDPEGEGSNPEGEGSDPEGEEE